MLLRTGVNRASSSVQDLNEHVQQASGRAQLLRDIRAPVEMLRAVGVSAINLDLMHGLPRQSLADVVGTAKLAASLSPWRLEVFGYAHVPW